MGCVLEYAYRIGTIRYDKAELFPSEESARFFIEEILKYSSCTFIYAKIRKIRYIKDICLKFNDKGELENEFYINPNQKY